MPMKSRDRSPHLIINKDEKKNAGELLIYDDIGPDWLGMIGANTIAKALKDLGEVGAITVRINSPGGSVFEGVAIYNQLKQHKAKVTVAIDGLAASIASIIAMAGDTVEIAENAMVMIHDPLAFVFGNSEELGKVKTLLDKVKETLVETYAARTGEKTSAEEISALMTAETWFTAKEALERGLVDKVGGNKKVTAFVDPTIYSYKNVPEQFRAEGRGQKAEGSEEPAAEPWRLQLAERELQLAERVTLPEAA